MLKVNIIFTGVFNISSKIFVSIDILFSMKDYIRKGEPPGNSATAVIRSILELPHAPNISPEEVRYLSEKLYNWVKVKLGIGIRLFVGCVESVPY